MKCERNIADRAEDCGDRIAYTPCGAPAPFRVDDEWNACEQHAREAELDECDVISF